MAVEVRVLGEVDARVDGQPVDLGHLRQRCVLAVLAVEANRIVPVDQLIDRVWGERPPDGARGSLYSYLTRLRRVLAPGGEVAITHRPGGYVLAVDPSTVDLHRFRDLLAQARAVGDDAACILYARALDLWRGEAFAGLDTPWLESERSAAEQERRAAELDHADLRLRRGEHDRLLPVLCARAGQQPLDERLAGQLMLAFYRSGRQADALATFHGTRDRLAEDLGVDPEPELGELYERILRGDPGLAAPAISTPEPEAPEPEAPEPLDRAARELATAVGLQWSAEVETRSLLRPEPVRLLWSSTDRPVSATESAILHGTGGAGHPERLRLRGDVNDLPGTFRKLPAHQMVILGQPGAGKTVLAMLLTLALLHDPQPGEATPVLLTLSSWNPDNQHLYTWIERKLAEEYPGLANTRAYGPDAAARLVAEGRVMPVLDGLDEVPPSLHAAAIDALDRAVAGGRPLVVTCRSAEYERAVRQGGSLLARAAVVEIEPVTPGDAVTFLTGRQRTGDTRWLPVTRHLAEHPNGALGRALLTPLMVDLARTAYTDPGTDPACLCDTTRFRGPAEIEDHLLDSFLPAVYARHPPAPGSEPARPRYPPERARQWLAFLAGYMRRQRTYDLAWWQLARAVPRSVKALLFGLPPAVLFAITGALVGGPFMSLVYGLSFAVIGCAVAGLSGPPGPRRVEVRFRGTAGRFAVRFAIGVAIAIGLGIGWSLPYPFTVVLAAVFGCAIGLHVWLDTPTDARRTPSPVAVLGQERVSALSFILAVALSLGLFYGLAFTESREAAAATALAFKFDPRLAVPGGVAAALLGWFSFGRLGLAYGLAGAVVAGQILYRTVVSLPLALGAGSLFAVAIGLTLVASRAWGVYLVTRCWLAARGRLPLRLMRFLDDAHHRGVLRHAGAVYQFRHARLQDRLSSHDPAL